MSATGDDAATPRWFTDNPETHSDAYVRRFRQLAEQGVDIVGEARLVDALVAPDSRILDAGCGPGRVGAELARRGHEVVGVDIDATLVAAAREDHPGPTWVVADLATLALDVAPFDAVVCAGNVLPYLAPGTELAVLSRLFAHVREDGIAVFGFGTGRGYSLDRFDADAAAAGWVREHRFATWDLRPWPEHPPASAGAPPATEVPDFAVTLLRHP